MKLNPMQFFNSWIMARAVEQIKQAIVESEQRIVMTNKAQLDEVIKNLPQQIEDAVEAALAPVIQAIKDSAAAEDLTDEVTALQNLGATVGAKVASDLTPPANTAANA